MNDPKSLWFLENIDISGLFCPKKMDSAHEAQTHKTFKKGDYIYLPEEHADKVYFLTEGRVKIGNYGDSGKEITKTILGPGEVFGELSLIGQTERRDFAYAMEKTSCCVLTVDEMKNLMRDHGGLNLFLMKIMGSRVLQMEQRLESLVFKDSRTRIVEFILEMAEKRGQRVGYEYVVRKFITHQEIANITATSRQTVTTVLNELRNKNLLTFDRRRLLIRDLDALRQEIT
ncbi:Crp/Fnr family transcriptional regulator [Flavilitoribacter nigricans]|uniref:Transcriptional regulator n=1 Tax=Flavilitoribacter nigricans (strain ATCC 23147 / DSM 23189 / NBRC 102662 / NCIMB 1420 / SS-2) TaxID=1122177 RepID=A0A2D0N597_FLAN2|nr:Crp/Fnr family transcriptional regulator [Flavilitoribacter nigricans]PHN03674.1 transcriptional regulator [Flavilitoribacter nigricans DSM 23189 = NBRC 102662]